MTGDRLARVAYVCRDRGVPVFGGKGCSVHVQAVLRELVGRAGEVHVFTPRVGGQPPAGLEGVVVHELATTADADERTAAAADCVGGIPGFDLVYERYALFSAATQELAARRGWPGVLEINSPLVDEQARHRTLDDRAGAIAATRRAVRAAAFPYAVSPPVARWAAALADRDVATIGNGVDVAAFTPARSARGPREPLTLCFVGSFRPWHRVELLIPTLAAVTAAGAPPVRLLLIGDGPRLADVVADARAAGLVDHVVSTGAVPPSDVPQLLAGADIALAPYGAGDDYFSPLKVFEYLAAGVPVVATAIGQLPELLAGGVEAMFTEPGDDAAFVTSVGGLAADPVRRAQIGAAARRAAEERFSWSQVVDRVLAGATRGAIAGRAAAA